MVTGTPAMRKTLGSLKSTLRGSLAQHSEAKNGTTRKVLGSTLNAAETSIRLLNELSNTVPFLGGATSATIFIIEQCRKYVRNSEAFDNLLKSLQSLENMLTPYKQNDLPAELARSVKEFVLAVSDIRTDVQSLQSSNRFSRIVNNSDNEARVADLLQKVKIAIDKIMEITLAQSLHSLNPVHSARYNCVDRDQCLDGTRVTVLEDIQNWFNDGEEQVYWLNGAAGMGKTTIALSIAHRLATNDQLFVATFFCSRELVDRKNASLIFPTLACQLASLSHEYHDALVDVVARFPYIRSALPHEQVQRLIIEPLKQCQLPNSIALIIDALDECDGERASEKILLALLQHVCSTPSLKVFVSCRPAAYVETLLSAGEHRRMFKLHHVPASIINSDLQLFYHRQLEEIRVAKKVEAPDWPPDILVQKLVQHAAGLFIFAVTVCKYLDSRGDVKRRLEYIANLPMTEHKDSLSVDRLYTEVILAALERIPDERDRRDFARVLATVMLAQEPVAVDALGGLLNIDSSIIYDVLQDIHPILSVPDEAGTVNGEVVHTFHASFPDYMTSHDRIGVKVPTLYIDPKDHNLDMALCCLSCLNKELKRILPFSKRFFANEEIDGLDLTVREHVSKALRYAVLYWADHLSTATRSGPGVGEVLEQLRLFADTKLLFWLESTSLLSAAGSVLGMAVKGRNWLKINYTTKYEPTLQLLQDLYHAVNDSYPIIHNYASHIYISFVLFLPQETSLYRQYSHHLPSNWKVINSGSRTAWNGLIRSTRTNLFADLISFSPDETHIIFVNQAIQSLDILSSAWTPVSRGPGPVGQTWNIDMVPGVDADFPGDGWPRGTEQPSMTSTICLPDGTIITCCTILTADEEPRKSHCFVSLWDADTGVHKQLLHRVSEEMDMFLPVIAVSSDFRFLGLSTPSVLRLWNTETWSEVVSLSSPTPFYRCFSVSKKHYLIGSEIRQLANNAAVLRELDIDPIGVVSTSFSRDGDFLALGLTSGRVDIWTVSAGTLRISIPPVVPLSRSTPLPLVAFSPTNDLLATACNRNISFYLLAKTQISQLLNTVRPPAAPTALIFSPGGQYIACKYDHMAVDIWSTAALLASNKPPHEVDFSKSPRYLALMADPRFGLTGDRDGRLSIWDCDTGLLVQDWVAHEGSQVGAIAVSSDGRFLASSSNNDTRIWSFKNVGSPKLVVSIPTPSEEAFEGFPILRAVSFNLDCTMLAIATPSMVEIWKLTASNDWEMLVKFEPGVHRDPILEPEQSDVDDQSPFVDNRTIPLNVNGGWLLQYYHRLDHEILGAHSTHARLRGPFLWFKSSTPKFAVQRYSPSGKLCFSSNDQYILALAGIYETATGRRITMIENELKDPFILKYFWSNLEERNKRTGLKTLHPLEYSDSGWIGDSKGRRCFWMPQSHYSDWWTVRIPGYSCSSEGDRFAFISRQSYDSSSDLVFVNVPGAEADE
ncbi:hypothetical protein D9757_009635 [Collybiopsis confluens]|uniref:NACHT domain-containing protein n=1 Tax=Collybiopsis confluens TaxID=2823264 RepID=A0A8H5GWU3_9AGAR|nr:hypothetical protein D9757_009635 [Collybiopsis confluens]